MDHMQVNMAESAHNTPPNDSMQDDASPQQPTPERIRHLPEWEVPVHPPRHRRRGSDSLFGRLFQIPTTIAIPSPTITLPDALKRHQTTHSPRPKTQPRGRSTPINKNDISSPFGFTHTSTGNPSPVSSMARLQRDMTLGSPTGSGPLLPMHHAGPGPGPGTRYASPSPLSSPTMSAFSPSPPSTPLERSQPHDHVYDQESQQARDHNHFCNQESPLSPDNDHVYDQQAQQTRGHDHGYYQKRRQPRDHDHVYPQQSPQSPYNDHVYDPESQQTPDEKAARITSEQQFQQSASSLASIFPRLKNQMTSAALPPSPLYSGPNNPRTPSNQFHSPRALGFLGSSPPNANPGRGHQRYESAGNPTLESRGYRSRESQTVEKPLFPMNLPPKRRRMLYIIIPLSTILLLALILGLGLGLGLRSRFDDTNRLSRGGASNGDDDGSGNLGSGNDDSSTLAPVPTSSPNPDLSNPATSLTSTVSIFTSPSTTPTRSPNPNPNPNSSPVPEPSANPDSSIGPRPDPQPTILPIPNDPAIPSTLYPAPETSPASPDTIIWTSPTPTPDNSNPDARPNPNPSQSPEPIPSPNEPVTSPTAGPGPGLDPSPQPEPAPPEDPNEPYQPEPYEPAPPQDPEVPQYGNPTPTNTASDSSGNGSSNGNGSGNDNDNGNDNGNGGGGGNKPFPTTRTGTGTDGGGSGGSDTAPPVVAPPVPRPSNLPLPLPPPFSTNTGPFKGNLLAYNAIGVAACGEINNDNDLIGAIAWEVFDAASTLAAGDPSLLSGSGSTYSGGQNQNPLGNPNDNPLCGRKIRVSLDKSEEQDGDGTASEIIVRIVDRCTSCLPTELGLSSGVFGAFGDEEAVREGRAKGVWEWLA